MPNICSRATRKCYVFSPTNHMLGTLDFTGSLHLAPFNFPQSSALLMSACTVRRKLLEFWNDYEADLATERERHLTTARANQTTGLTNG